jgi:hypothetical protein
MEYPAHLRLDFERRWAVRRNVPRPSPPQGTFLFKCGHTVVAPARSSYAPAEVSNFWECSACGEHWTTTEPMPGAMPPYRR